MDEIHQGRVRLNWPGDVGQRVAKTRLGSSYNSPRAPGQRRSQQLRWSGSRPGSPDR